MNRLNLGILILIYSSIVFLNCNDIVKPKSFSKNDIIGYWHEAKTSYFSEGWRFSDTSVVHIFKDSDTIGNYPAWKISNDTIFLTNEKNNEEVLIFKKISTIKMNLKYYIWNKFIDKDFFRE